MNKKNNIKQFVTILVSILLIIACANSREQAIPITADFSFSVVNNDYSVPVQVKISNETEGAEEYNWTFEGGSPSISTDRNPGTIVYTQKGIYTIVLEATNQDGSLDTKEITIDIDAEVITGFSTEIIESNYPPMEVAITNTTIGATAYNWTFEGGTPATTTVQYPDNVVFNTPGEHRIVLEVTNGLETYEVEETVTVAPNLLVDFYYDTSFDDNDYQVPVTFQLYNTSISATDYVWTFEGGNPSTITEENPSVTFTTPGTYSLTLTATNGKETNSNTKEVTVVENTNLRVFENIQLGINTAHTNNGVGAFFSTLTGEVYAKEEVTAENGSLIDVVFFGLNEGFTFNKFVSPSEVASLTFDAIPNAISTTVINKQESCECNAVMTVSTFDEMLDDTELESLEITEVADELQDFDATTIPRIVLFETQDGRKGAIKIKEFIVNGDNSYINTDIKVQKE